MGIPLLRSTNRAPPREGSSQGEHAHYIDLLRGIAIVGVVALHSLQAVPPTHPVLRLALLAGVRGVQLFYVVSAVTLCFSWQRRRVSERFALSNFFIRRCFRIVPLFAIAVGFYLILYGFTPRHWCPSGIRLWFIPATLAMQHGWHPETINAIVPGGWSVAVEVTFYAILPILMPYLQSVRNAIGFLMVSGIVCMLNERFMPGVWASSYDTKHQYLVEAFTFFNFFSQLPVFALGIVTYHAVRAHSVLPIIVATLPCLLISVLSNHSSGNPSPTSLFSHHSAQVCVLCFLVYVLSAVNCQSILLAPIRFAGRASYGVYLSHVAVIDGVEWALDWPAQTRGDLACLVFFGVTVCSAVLIAECLRRVIEAPCIKLGSRVIEARAKVNPGNPCASSA